jgi:hypothetical protein
MPAFAALEGFVHSLPRGEGLSVLWYCSWCTVTRIISYAGGKSIIIPPVCAVLKGTARLYGKKPVGIYSC